MNELSKEELRKEYNDLQKRYDELAANLYRVNNKLKESEALKGHFISNITNEIINPFSSILLLAENMQHLKDDEITKSKEMAALIYNDAFHLDFQLKNIFAAAAIEAGKDGLKPVSVDLKQLLRKVIRFFERNIQSKDVSINLVFDDKDNSELFSSFITDEEKLELILKNLLDNAIKFSSEKGQIDVTVSVAAEGCSISVFDQGKGIPKEKMQEIFDRFKQLNDRIDSVNTGHGLGLSIVHSYIQFLNGDMKLVENDGGGTGVIFTIPQLRKDDDWEKLDDFLIDPDQKF